MSAATILFSDIVSFSRKPTEEQRRLVEALTTEVLYETRLLLNPAGETPSIIALPTGDGAALAFLHRSVKTWTRETILRLIARMQRWAFGETGVELRIGVHVGQIEIITDINGRQNLCGDTINYAQRVMDAANAKQVLFSEAAFREYIGASSGEIRSAALPEGVVAEFGRPIEVFAKHNLQILVYKMELRPEQDYWENADPVAKHLMAVSLTGLPKSIEDFSVTLDKARRISLIQLKGDRLLPKLKDGTKKLNTELQRMWVFMPDPVVNGRMTGTPPEQLQASVEEWRVYLTQLKAAHPRADLKLGLFREIPYFGASFLDWEQPGGLIHVSPYIWNIPTQDCPGYDLKWLGAVRSIVYETYVTGLEYLNSTTANALLSQP